MSVSSTITESVSATATVSDGSNLTFSIDTISVVVTIPTSVSTAVTDKSSAATHTLTV